MICVMEENEARDYCGIHLNPAELAFRRNR